MVSRCNDQGAGSVGVVPTNLSDHRTASIKQFVMQPGYYAVF